MDHIDAKVFALISAGVVIAVAAVKRGWPTWVGGKEEFLATALPIAFVVAAKLLGGFKATDWFESLIWALASGPFAGLLHDKLVNPVIKFTSKPKS